MAFLNFHEKLHSFEQKGENSSLTEQNYLEILDALPSGIVVQNSSGKITSFNSRALQILGVTSQEFLGRSSSDREQLCFYPNGETFPGNQHPAIQTLKTGKAFQNVEMMVKRLDNNQTVYISINSTPLFKGKDKLPYAVLTSFNDITNEKQHERELAERNQFFKAIYENADVSIWITRVNDDGSLDLIDNNSADTAISGNKYDIDHPVPFEKGYPGEAYSEIIEKYNMCISGKRTVSFEEKIIQGGEEKWFLSTLTPISDFSQKVVMIIGTAKEITAKKSEEKKLLNLQSSLRSHIDLQNTELKRKENLYRLIGQNFPDGDIFIIDKDNNILIAEGTEIIGQKKERVEGKSVKALFTDDLFILLADALKDVFQNQIVEYEYIFNNKEYQMKLVPVKDEMNKVYAALCVSQNITRLNKANRYIHQVLKTESALSRASRILLSGDYTLSTIEEALKVILESISVSRIYIFENFTDRDKLYCRQIAEVCQDGVDPQIDDPELQGILYEQHISRWEDLLQQNKIIAGMVKDFPLEEREILEPQGIKSILVFPVFVSHHFWGFIGFDDVYQEREWDQNHIYLLSTFADMLSSHLSNEKIDHKLRFEQKRYQKLANSITDTFYSIDRNFRIRFWNNAAEKLTHLPKNKIIGRHLSDFLPGENVEKLHALFEKCLTTGETSDIQIDWEIDNEIRNFDVRIYPFSDGLSILVKEVTAKIKIEKALHQNQKALEEQKISLERKNLSLMEAQDELSKSHSRYYDLYENAPAGYFSLDIEGLIIEVNQTLLKMIGINEKNLKGRPFSEIIFPEDRDVFRHFLKEKTGKKAVSTIEARLLCKDNEIRYVAISSNQMEETGNKYKFTAVDINRLKETQKLVEKNETILTSLIRNLPVELFVLDQNNTIFIQNQRSKEKWGDFQGKNVEDIQLPPSLSKATLNTLSSSNVKGNYDTVYFNHLRKDYVYEQIFSKIVVQDEFVGNLCILIDVSEERRMEAEILQVREDTINTIESILRFLPNGLLVFDDHMQLIRDNETYRRIIEVYAPQLKYTTDDLDRLIQQNVFTILKTGKDTQIIIHQNTFDGKENDDYLALDMAYAKIQQNGEERLLVSLKDATSQLMAIREIEEKERLYNTLANNIPDTDIYVFDKDLNFLLADGKLKEKYGFGFDFTLGRSIYDIISDSEVGISIKEMFTESLQGKTIAREFYYKKDYFDVTTLPLLDKHKEVFAVMGIFRIITRMKVTQIGQQRLINKEREINLLRSRFLSTMSHEFRTPLSVISTTVQLFEKMPQLLDSDKRNDLFTRMHNAASFMVSILDDINFISLDQSERLQFNPTKTNIESFCKQIIQEVKFSMPEKQIKFSYEGEKKELSIDHKLMRHILNNLLNNAVKYSLESKKPVELSASTDTNRLFVSVIDYGIGMTNEEVNQVFEPFYRGAKVEKIKGTGLGMSIVKRCVALHEGEILIESNPGVGTVIKINIPLD